MNEKPNRKHRFFRLSLRSAILLTSLAAAFIAYVSYHREKGNDQLIADLQGSGGVCHFRQPDKPDDSDRPFWLKQKWRSLIGSSNPLKVSAVEFKTESETDWQTVLTKPGLARRMARNLNTSGIDQLTFTKVTIGSDCSPFFSNWSGLKRLWIFDTAMPETWDDGIAKIPNLEEVIISGSLCTVDPECFVQSQSLKSLILAHRGISSKRLQELREQMPGVKIELLGSFDSRFNLAGKVLSQNDEQASAKLKTAFDELQDALRSLDPPAKNKFSKPATLEEISRLEQVIGMPLHPTLRAWLELHNGQPGPGDELMLFEQLLSVDRIINDFEEWQSLGGDWKCNYRFVPDYNHQKDGNENINPNLMTIGSSEDHMLMFNNVTGKLFLSYSEIAPDYFLPDLESYFLAIAEEIRAQRIKVRNGYVRLEIEIGRDPFKKWRDEKPE